MSQLPYDLEAEQALLGAFLHDNHLLERADGLAASHFYDPVHGRLFAQIQTVAAAGQNADAVALREWAQNDGGMAQLGGAVYLMKLLDAAAPLSAQVQTYARMVADQARRRAIIAAANEAIAEAHAGDGDALASLEARLRDIDAESAGADAWRRLGDVTAEAARLAGKGELKGISTGFRELDALTGGLQPGTLWFIGGATSMGKSVFAAAIGRNVARGGYAVAENHLEMDDRQIGIRTATALGADQHHRYGNPHYLSAMRGDLGPEQWARLRDGAAAAADLPIYVDARPSRTLAQIESGARRLARAVKRDGRKLGAVIIDHEGLIASEPGQRFASQLERTNARAEGLMGMAKRLHTCVIALCQVTKEGKRADGDERLPTTDDLKYGGALAEAAQVALLLHRRAYYAERKPRQSRTTDDMEALASRDCTVIVDKARGGKRGQLTVLMDLPTAAVWEPGEVLS